MDKERAIRCLEQWFYAGWQQGDAAKMAACLSEDFVDQDSSGRSPDAEGFSKAVNNLYAAFPDFYGKIEEIIWDNEKNRAAVRWTAEGTHRKLYLGLPPTNKKIRFKGIEMLVFREKEYEVLISERWGEWDGLDLLEQMK